jgi:hypothetical protein
VQVQVQVQWGEPDEQPRHALALGAGSEMGLIGLRYVQFTPGSPVAWWVAGGSHAAGVGWDVSLPSILFHRPLEVPVPTTEGFVTIGLTFEYAEVPRAAGTGVASIGLRRWFKPRRFSFLELSFGVNQHLWGGRPWGGDTGAAARLQWGLTF